jgi:lysophospholipase L1-like esterase
LKRWIVSANFLERVAEPASRFQPDYLAYQNGEITQTELIARLPHVAMIGDSVCMNVCISSILSTSWRARTCQGRNWFLDINPSPKSVRSVSKRLEKLTPFIAIEYAGVGALVDREGERENLFRRVLGTRNFSGQINQLLTTDRFPDLVLISIGHNNVDWTWWCRPDQLNQPEDQLRRQGRKIRENFERQMRRLIEHARIERRRVAIIVFGLINFDSYFKGREDAENRRASAPTLYPHLETTYKYFKSFQPAYRRNVVRLAGMVNNELRAMVNDLNGDLEASRNIHLEYSDALARADLSRAELLHAVDGCHASVEGHNVLADAAFGALGSSLKFLGIDGG